MRTVYRPFTKVITVAAGANADVVLTDSQTSAISCNFVSVESASGTAADGYIYVQPVSGNAAGAGALGGSATSTSYPTGAAASGMLGVALPNLNGVAQLVLGIGDRVNTINLLNSGASPTACIVTYGNVNVQNTIKDTGFGRGA